MPTLEEVNAMLDARAMGGRPISVSQPVEPADLERVVAALMSIAETLRANAGSVERETDPELVRQCEQMTGAAAAIARAVAPISEALRGFEMPAPVINVSPAPVTVERGSFPKVAHIRRNQAGEMTAVVFEDDLEDDDDSSDSDDNGAEFME